MDPQDMSMVSFLDTLAALVQTEAQHYGCVDYCQKCILPVPAAPGADGDVGCCDHSESMKNSPSTTSLYDVRDIDRLHPQPQPEPETFRFWRQQMLDWAMVVVDSFGMDRELVAVAFNLLDRYLTRELSKAKAAPVTRDDFQLFVMTCLYLAIKLNEPYPRKLGVEALVKMSRGFYSAEDITLTEQDILQSLQWRVNPPTSYSFIRIFLDVLPEDMKSTRMQNTAMTLSEVGMSCGTLISSRESHVGLACVLYAARLDSVSEGRLQDFLTTIESVVPSNCSADFDFVYRSLEQAYNGF